MWKEFNEGFMDSLDTSSETKPAAILFRKGCFCCLSSQRIHKPEVYTQHCQRLNPLTLEGMCGISC